jgi:hypothetical protein
MKMILPTKRNRLPVDCDAAGFRRSEELLDFAVVSPKSGFERLVERNAIISQECPNCDLLPDESLRVIHTNHGCTGPATGGGSS